MIKLNENDYQMKKEANRCYTKQYDYMKSFVEE
ncbi:hypothetical protein BB14905_04268 [Bacillus sp. B14905]|nr:hypothetical protein BB14905_04268 [Bacillus sp. B14905]